MNNIQLKNEILKLQKNDYSSYENFYNLTVQRIYNLLTVACGDENIANGIIAEVYNNIYASIGNVNVEAADLENAFYIFAGTIATDAALKAVATEESEGFDEALITFERAVDDGERFIPEQILRDMEIQKLLLGRISAMPFLNRIVLQYFYCEGLSVSEISAKIGKSNAEVKKIIAKIRKDLQEFASGYPSNANNLYSLGAIPLIWLGFANLLDVIASVGTASGMAAAAIAGGAGNASVSAGSGASVIGGSVGGTGFTAGASVSVNAAPVGGSVATMNAASTGGATAMNAASASENVGVAAGSAAGTTATAVSTTASASASLGIKIALGAALIGAAVGSGAATIKHAIDPSDKEAEATITDAKEDDDDIDEKETTEIADKDTTEAIEVTVEDTEAVEITEETTEETTEATTEEVVVKTDRELYEEYIYSEWYVGKGYDLPNAHGMEGVIPEDFYTNPDSELENWFTPEPSLLGYYIGDFVGDEAEELVLFVLEKDQDADEKVGYRIDCNMYVIEEGKVELAHEETLNYDDREYAGLFYANAGLEKSIYVRAVKRESMKDALIIEYHSYESRFADGKYYSINVKSGLNGVLADEVYLNFFGSNMELLRGHEILYGVDVECQYAVKGDPESDQYINQCFEKHGIDGDFASNGSKSELTNETRDIFDLYFTGGVSEELRTMMSEHIDYSMLHFIFEKYGARDNSDSVDTSDAGNNDASGQTDEFPITVTVQWEANKHTMQASADMELCVDIMDDENSGEEIVNESYEASDGITQIVYEEELDLDKQLQYRKMKFSNVDNHYNIYISHAFMMCTVDGEVGKIIIETPKGETEYNWSEHSDMLYRSYTGAWMFGFGIENGEIVDFDSSKFKRE